MKQIPATKWDIPNILNSCCFWSCWVITTYSTAHATFESSTTLFCHGNLLESSTKKKTNSPNFNQTLTQCSWLLDNTLFAGKGDTGTFHGVMLSLTIWVTKQKKADTQRQDLETEGWHHFVFLWKEAPTEVRAVLTSSSNRNWRLCWRFSRISSRVTFILTCHFQESDPFDSIPLSTSSRDPFSVFDKVILTLLDSVCTSVCVCHSLCNCRRRLYSTCQVTRRGSLQRHLHLTFCAKHVSRWVWPGGVWSSVSNFNQENGYGSAG